MNLRLFLSVLLVYRSNFQLLQWNAVGDKFDLIHDKSADYYEKILGDADSVAEMAMRIGLNPVNYPEAYQMLQDAEHQFKILTSDATYNFNDFVENTEIMFTDILFCIENLFQSDELQEISNVGIKATLESMYNEYDLQTRYINKHRVETPIERSDEEDNQDIDQVENNDDSSEE